MAGWVKIYRQLQENAIWMSNEPFDSRSAWIDLILMANHEDKEIYQAGKFLTIKRGQLHRSQVKLAERWHWNKKRVNNFLKELKKVNMIDYETAKGGSTNGTTITIVNYSVFQVSGATEGTTEGTTPYPTEGASKGQRWDNALPINKNIKNNKEYKKESEEPELPPVKKSRFPVGKYQNVFLSNDEAAKLNQEFGLVDSQRVIEKLSEYMQTSGKKYADHYAVIAKWIREDRANPKPAPKPNKVNDYNQRNYTNEDITDMERKKLSWMYED